MYRLPPTRILQAVEWIRSRAKPHHVLIILLGVKRAKVRPTQTEVDGEVWPNLEIVLDEDSAEILTIILPVGKWNASGRVKLTAKISTFSVRRIVREIPYIVETEAGTGRVDWTSFR